MAVGVVKLQKDMQGKINMWVGASAPTPCD